MSNEVNRIARGCSDCMTRMKFCTAAGDRSPGSSPAARTAAMRDRRLHLRRFRAARQALPWALRPDRPPGSGGTGVMSTGSAGRPHRWSPRSQRAARLSARTSVSSSFVAGRDCRLSSSPARAASIPSNLVARASTCALQSAGLQSAPRSPLPSRPLPWPRCGPTRKNQPANASIRQVAIPATVHSRVGVRSMSATLSFGAVPGGVAAYRRLRIALLSVTSIVNWMS